MKHVLRNETEFVHVHPYLWYEHVFILLIIQTCRFPLSPLQLLYLPLQTSRLILLATERGCLQLQTSFPFAGSTVLFPLAGLV